MKNLIKFISLLGLPIILFYACNSGIKGEGGVVMKEFRQNGDFSYLSLHGNYDVMYVSSPENKIVVEAQPNIINNLVIEKVDKKLFIEEKKPVHNSDVYKITIYGNSLENLDINDNISFKFSNPISKESFTINLVDNANLRLKMDVENLSLDMNDNSLLNVSGSISNLDATIHDNATIKAPQCVIHNADISINDNAQAILQITHTLKGRSTDNAIIEYKGDPNKDFNTKDQSKIIKISN